MLKEWSNTDAHVLRLLIIAEGEEETVLLTEPPLPEHSQAEMDTVLEEFADMTSGRIGKTEEIHHKINMPE